MTRLVKLIVVTGSASAWLLNAPCSYGGNGISLIPNNVPNPFTPLLYSLARGLMT